MTKKRKYTPSIVVRSDDLIITDPEGNEHKPHEGEWVRFRRSVPIGVMRAFMRASQLGNLDEDLGAGAVEMADELLTQVSEALARQIIDWNWTDEDWEPLPRPGDDPAGFREAIWNLEDEELEWLRDHLMDGADVEKN